MPTNRATTVYSNTLYICLGLCPCVQSAEHFVSIVLSPAERLTCSPFPFVSSFFSKLFLLITTSRENWRLLFFLPFLGGGPCLDHFDFQRVSAPTLSDSRLMNW
ncbi:Uncharacterized protein APZ42_026834 [Daphnia magna]|uniref:Uncharacterized protein n=1 Tax=Daphnia magna TaxID=35525 RepID=A0A164RZ46_9CRUS|nr:Uncharacterized protein APZ42_026834 [Daphnia magna]